MALLAANFSGVSVPVEPEVMVSAYTGNKTKPVPNEDETIAWRSERKLNWEDFRCMPQKQGDAVASTSTSLGISYQVKNDVLIYDISCHFSKKKSWGVLKTDYILAHEQAHFDITELHARKLYEALYNYEFNSATFKKDIAAIYEGIVKEKEAMQEAYDRETDHSRRRRAQFDWLERIDSMLSDTELYSSYP